MLGREHAKPDGQRVTAGIPSLSPGKRHDITDKQLLRYYQQSLLQEVQDREAAAKAPDGDIEDVTDKEQIVGIPMEGFRLVSRLTKLAKANGHRLWSEPSNADPNTTGLYLLKNDMNGGQEKQFIVGIMTHMNPEFSLRVTDDEGNAKAILPGWRRALMKLIRARIITEAGAFAMFGPPSRQSENWARFTQ